MVRMQSINAPSIDELLERLREAVTAGDRERAFDLSQQIRQYLVAEAAESQDIERRVRALLADLEPARTPPKKIQPEVLSFLPDTGKESGVVMPVWYGTNRKPDGAGGYGVERHGEISRGRVLVHIPQTHKFGEIGRGFWERLRRFDLRDDRLKVQAIEAMDRSAFFQEIREAMTAARETEQVSQALVFLHGFNVDFEEAAIRAAQLGCDLKVPGATAFFSWPSRGSVTAYTADEATIEASEAAITEFLVDFVEHCGADQVHLIAHSMGNRGLLRALQRIASHAETRGRIRFGQIFLAAPDVDRDLFLDLARLYPSHSDRTTLYASNADKAVHLSARVHDAPRAGYFTPYTVVEGVNTIAVPDFDIDLLGHSYFAQADALLHDIFDLMRHNEAPDHRQRLERLGGSELIWTLAR